MIQQMFSPHVISLTVIALILFVTSKPMAQGASRLTELLIHLFGTETDARKRNIVVSADHSPEHHDIVGDTVVRDPIAVGVALYAFTFLDSSHVLIVSSEIGAGNMATIFSTMFAFGIFRVLASMKKSATRSTIPIAHAVSGIAFLVSFTLSNLAGLSLESVVAMTIVTLLCAEIAILVARGFRNYGLFSVFWLPVAAFSWLCRVFSIAIAAPIILPLMIAETALDRPTRSATFKPARSQSAPSS